MKNSKQHKIDINYVAKLANLELSIDEKEKFGGQIEEILGFVEQIQNVSGKVKEELKGQKLEEISDADEPRPSLQIDQVLSNTAKKDGKYFKVKAIFDA